MNIAPNTVVSFKYTLTDDAGNVLDQSGDTPLSYLQGHGNIIPGLEKALEGKTVGFAERITVAPAEAYGERHPDAVFEVPFDQFPGHEQAQIGAQVQGQAENGQVNLFHIVDRTATGIVLDGNHPMAGKTLHFAVEVTDVRGASAEEMEHGHAHTPGHSHHH